MLLFFHTVGVYSFFIMNEILCYYVIVSKKMRITS